MSWLEQMASAEHMSLTSLPPPGLAASLRADGYADAPVKVTTPSSPGIADTTFISTTAGRTPLCTGDHVITLAWATFFVKTGTTVAGLNVTLRTGDPNAIGAIDIAVNTAATRCASP